MYKKQRLSINPGETIVLVLNGGNGILGYKFLATSDDDDWLDLGYIIGQVKDSHMVEVTTGDTRKTRKVTQVKQTYYVLDPDAKTLQRATAGEWGKMFPRNYAKPVVVFAHEKANGVDVQQMPRGYVALYPAAQLSKREKQDDSVPYVVGLHREAIEVHEARLVALN